MKYLLFFLFFVVPKVFCIDSLLSASSESNKMPNINYNINMWQILLKLFIAIAIVVLVIFIIVKFFKHISQGKFNINKFPKGLYSVLGMTPLDFKRQLLVLKFYQTLYLIIIQEEQVNIIDKINDPDEIVDIEKYFIKDKKESFVKIFNKRLGSYDK